MTVCLLFIRSEMTFYFVQLFECVHQYSDIHSDKNWNNRFELKQLIM